MNASATNLLRAVAPGRGMWMGGWTPLGYDIKDRKLIVNEPEADLVRSIFGRFARGIPPQQLIEILANEGALNKQGKPIEKGYLYRILHNRVYLGEAVHKDTVHPGEHDQIIARALWDQVHALINPSPRSRATRALGRTPALLKGLMFGPTGTAMTPGSHQRKSGRLYRYYVSDRPFNRQGTSLITHQDACRRRLVEDAAGWPRSARWLRPPKSLSPPGAPQGRRSRV